MCRNAIDLYILNLHLMTLLNLLVLIRLAKILNIIFFLCNKDGFDYFLTMSVFFSFSELYLVTFSEISIFSTNCSIVYWFCFKNEKVSFTFNYVYGHACAHMNGCWIFLKYFVGHRSTLSYDVLLGLL